MTDETATTEAPVTPKVKKEPPVITPVRMDDGRLVDFVGKKKLLKETTIEGDTIKVRMDFFNGETRTFTLPPEMVQRFAGHGAEQKLGDETAGVDDVEDMIEAVDALMIRLGNGEWNVKRESGSGLAGTSILVRALVELTQKPVQQIRESLATKTQEEKMALRRNSKLRPIVERLEAEKNSRKQKKSGVDSDSLLEGFLADPNGAGAVAANQGQAAEAA